MVERAIVARIPDYNARIIHEAARIKSEKNAGPVVTLRVDIDTDWIKPG